MSKKAKPFSHAAEDRAEDEMDDDILEETSPAVPVSVFVPVPELSFPRWACGGGTMVDGAEAGKVLTDLLLLAENAEELAAIEAGTARLTHVKTASEDVLGIQVKLLRITIT